MIGRNDPCPCGSNKKYKKCCLNKVTKPFDEWKQRAHQLTENEILVETFFVVFNRALKNNWRGACHAVSSILYVLLREQGIDAQLRIGYVSSKKVPVPFSHSWITIDEKPYDIGLYRSNPVNPQDSYFTEVSPPIFKGINLDSQTETDIQFDVNSERESKDKNFQNITKQSLGQYMNDWPKHKNGLWNEVIEAATILGLNLKLNDLKDKYHKIKFQREVEKRWLS
ncbi:SEC-C metal-binding domain-containing protein [Bacillus swezeyi]|uniref:Nucleic acid-binding protein n=1 Tax=Bacillus swezeyi TaxID=1925020 RepID=A0A5M8RJB7_9BACI|nr:SEC-C metal-binding domain-containing protein [Bacillus swezeyi]KAA6446956.1 nucleic acid-binding protein [Bacillus swezeyi]KAA6471524.1 nucleic acid-binding protein [Bacillus swezeyi]